MGQDATAQFRVIQTDHDIARDIKERIVAAYEPILAILDDAVRQGFIVSVQTGAGPFEKQAILSLQVLKKF